MTAEQPKFFIPQPLEQQQQQQHQAMPEPTAQQAWQGFQPAQQFQQPPANHQHQQQPYGESQQPTAAEQPPQQPPAPIPAEHQIIQEVLENLRGKCQQGAAAAHPQVRRKLEDVAQKLDVLYTKLRASTLSPTTLQGLHTILGHIWQYDYQACFQVIAGLISGGSFAEMSDFMPGVKVLLQVAQQQGVYIEYQQK